MLTVYEKLLHFTPRPDRALRQGEFGKALYRARPAIERIFGNVTSFGGGLGPLPA